MKNTNRLSLILLVMVLLLALAGCTAIPNIEDGMVIGNNYRLAAGQTLNHDLTVIGGNAVLEKDSTVNGDVSIMGGTVRIDGKVNGDVSVMGGSVQLEDHAVVSGSLNQLGGSINQAEGAQVNGGTTDFNDNPPSGSTTMRAPRVDMNFDPIFRPVMAIFQALALAAVAVLAQLFAPNPMQRVGQAAQSSPLVTGAVGLLTIPVGFFMMVILVITIILSPVGLLGVLLLGLAVAFGWLALGLLTGQHLARLFKQNWTDPVCAGVGALALSLVASMSNLIWCIGWIVPVLISSVGLGAVVLTRFGTRTYVPPVSPQPYTPSAAMPAAVAVPAAATPNTGAQVYETPDVAEPPSDEPDLFDPGPTADQPDRS